MNILERIQELASERDVSIKRIERECGMGNGTIRKWGTQSPSIENVRKVANYLHVSLSCLIDEEDVGKNLTGFTKSEEDLLRLVHPLSEIDKIKVIGVIENYLFLSRRQNISGFHYTGDISKVPKTSINIVRK